MVSSGARVPEELRKRTQNSELNFGAPKTRFGEDPTDNRVVENGQNQLLELHFDGGDGGLLRELVVEMVIFGLSSLVGLRPFDGGHERVRHGRVIGELCRGDPVE